MTNRYHLPVVVTTTDDLTREEATNYVETTLANLEETEHVHRTFVEDTGIEEAEGESLLTMLEDIEAEDLQAAMKAMQELRDGDDSNE